MFQRVLLLSLALGAACATGAAGSRRAREGVDQPLPAPGAAAADAGGAPPLLPSEARAADRLGRRMAAAHRARGRGRPAATVLVRGELGVGQEQGFTVELQGSACYTLVAVGESDGVVVDLLLLDAEGAEVGEDRRRDSVASVEICPPRSGRYRAVVRMYEGGGGFAFQVFGS